MSTTTDLNVLKINYLSQAQYDEALENDEIDDNELYLTPAPSPTDVPTANTISKFDSSACMNSTDMTTAEVTSFVNGLNVRGISAADYVVEQGFEDIWTYRKWQSGIAECWGAWSGTLSHYSTPFGGYGYNTGDIDLPTNLFTEIPIVTYSGKINNGFVLTGTVTNASLTTSTVRGYLVSSASGEQDVTIYFRIIGRWK